MTTYSYAEQADEVRREIGMRERVYPRRIADGKMSQAQADRQIAVMTSVLHTIEQQDALQRPELFPR